MTVSEEIRFEDTLRHKLEPIFGADTKRKMDALAMKSVMDKNRDMQILLSFASTLEVA